jgi:hypothetical protein
LIDHVPQLVWEAANPQSVCQLKGFAAFHRIFALRVISVRGVQENVDVAVALSCGVLLDLLTKKLFIAEQ